jgi:hypothetical protein
LKLRFQALAITLTFAAAATTPACAQIYKWVDEHGVTHYDASPPPSGASGKTQTLNIPAKSAASESSGQSWAEKDSAFQQRYDKQKAKEAKDEADQKEAQLKRHSACIFAREQLEGILSASSVFHLDDQGNRQYLSDQQREQRVAELRQSVSENCNR